MLVDKVVLIPGICGSVLMDGAELVWPGTPFQVLFKSFPDHLVQKLATSQTLRATDILRSVPLTVAGIDLHHFDGYGKAVAAIEALGFSEQAGTLVPFAYDWRQDVRTSAQALHDRLKRDMPAGTRLGIVAHSMGGLVARYMLERIGLPPGLTVAIAVMVAVPHLGAPASLQNIVGLRPEVFLSPSQCKIAVGNPQFPSAYQLLPRATLPALLEASVSFGYRERDILSAPVQAMLGLSAHSLAAASGLWDELPMIDSAWTAPCRYFAIAGNEQRTIAANYLGVPDTLAQTLEEPGAGDGTVPLWSAAPASIPVRYVPAEHGSMFGDPRTRQLLRTLLRPDLPIILADFTEGTSISVQSTAPSVEAGGQINVALVADQAVKQLEGALVVETFRNGERAAERRIPIAYRGGELRSLSIDVIAPDEGALLRLSFQQPAPAPAGHDAVVLVLPPG